MANLNKINLIGNVGTIPELRFTKSGKPVANFTVASNHSYRDSEGEQKEETDWFSVVVWGKLAENCNQYLEKGHLVFVSGRVTLHKWTSQQDDKEHSRLELQANQVIFLHKSSHAKEDSVDELEPEDIPF